MTLIDCISDTHGEWPELEGGDILIVAGDHTAKHTENEFKGFDYWIKDQKYKKKIVIGGNHDFPLQDWQVRLQFCDYLIDSETHYENLIIWGSPWTAMFCGINQEATAFTMPFGCDMEAHLDMQWKMIPKDIDILVTHCPPYGVLDSVSSINKRCGSLSLYHHVINRIKPKLHVFGHLHQDGGQQVKIDNTIFVNAAIMDDGYEPSRKPVRIIL